MFQVHAQTKIHLLLGAFSTNDERIQNELQYALQTTLVSRSSQQYHFSNHLQNTTLETTLSFRQVTPYF